MSDLMVAELCEQFLNSDRDAFGWTSLYPDESQWESPDCDVMSQRFMHFARERGFDGFLVKAETLDEGHHWFAVLAGDDQRQIAVDWTARQFWNAGHPVPTTDPALIPCPLVFEWPGQYPLEVVEFVSMTVRHRTG